MSFECSAISYNKTTCIIVLYRSPTEGDFDIFIRQLTFLLEIATKNYKFIYICGDLNIDKLKLNLENCILHDVLQSFGLESIINVPTRIENNGRGMSQTAVDYLISNSQNVNYKIIEPGISDHTAQLLTCLSDNANNVPLEETGDIYRRNVNKFSIEHFKFLFTNTHLTLFDNSSINNINAYFDLFWDVFEYSFETAFPKRKVNNNVKKNSLCNKFKFSPALQAQSQKLKEMNALRKIIGNEDLNSQYKINKKLYIQNIAKEKQQFNKNMIDNSQNKTKTLWNIVNKTLDRKKTKFNIVLDYNDRKINDKNELVNIFADHFSTDVKNKLNVHFPSLSNNCTSMVMNEKSMFFNPVTYDEVKNIILELSNKRSTGFDEVPIVLIKECVDEFALCFALIINKSIELGEFPKKLKTAIIIPVYKKGEINNIQNYRPISLLSVFSKIIEKVLANRIFCFLDKHNLITNCQHGFRSKCSTETAAIDLVQFVNKCLDSNQYVMGVFFDLSSAFDTLDISFICEKLEKLGIRGNINSWITSFLTDRRLFS